MRISDWSSDVCSSDLHDAAIQLAVQRTELVRASASDDPLRYDDALADQAMVLSQAGRYAQAEPIEREPQAGYRTLYAADSQRSGEGRVGNGYVQSCGIRWSPHN